MSPGRRGRERGREEEEEEEEEEKEVIINTEVTSSPLTGSPFPLDTPPSAPMPSSFWL